MHKSLFKGGVVFLLMMFSHFTSLAQEPPTSIPYFKYDNGLGLTSPDSIFLLNLRFRMQNRVGVWHNEQGPNDESIEARVRRLRLRLEGFLYSPRLTYTIQLSFTRGDMDYDNTEFPNIVRDAMVLYAVSKKFSIGMGQTKLPGNRQRVISSGDQQLVDRSIVNAAFNIDRDFGIQLYYTEKYYSLRGALSSGEGRNFTFSGNGLAYTVRSELLPFGRFTGGGDYFEGDFYREPTPKLSVGLTYSFNNKAVRTGGQLGRFLHEPRDMTTYIADFVLKYQGFALSGEVLQRQSDNPITESPEGGSKRYIFTGWGKNIQGSYLLHNNWEVIGRYSEINPGEKVQALEKSINEYTVGVTKYIKGHRVKFQSDVTYRRSFWEANPLQVMNGYGVRFQVEVGI